MSEISYRHIQRLASNGMDPQSPPAVRLSANIVNGWLEENAMPPNDEIVMIPKSEYDELTMESRELGALHAVGVDNWEGYGEAMSQIDDEDDDAEEDEDNEDGDEVP